MVSSDHFLRTLCQSCAALLFSVLQHCQFFLLGTFRDRFADSFVASIREKDPSCHSPAPKRTKSKER